MQFELTTEEAVLLKNVLERDLGDLRSEIYKTENAQMRSGLKENEEVMKGILARLEPLTAGLQGQ